MRSDESQKGDIKWFDKARNRLLVVTLTIWMALAALVGRGAADDDPRVIGCRAALAFHRVRRVIDAERGHLDPADADALQEALTMS